MSTFGVFIVSVATTIAVGTTVGFASQDGGLGLRWAAIAGACGAIATVYSFCRQLALSNDGATPIFRYLFAFSEAMLILAGIHKKMFARVNLLAARGESPIR